jgi:hypothetical protein
MSLPFLSRSDVASTALMIQSGTSSVTGGVGVGGEVGLQRLQLEAAAQLWLVDIWRVSSASRQGFSCGLLAGWHGSITAQQEMLCRQAGVAPHEPLVGW